MRSQIKSEDKLVCLYQSADEQPPGPPADEELLSSTLPALPVAPILPPGEPDEEPSFNEQPPHGDEGPPADENEVDEVDGGEDTSDKGGEDE